MAIEVKVPSVGESVAEGILTTWSVPDGGYVEKGQTLFELETDKASTDVPAPESGVLHHSVPEGEEVTIGSVVGTIDPEGKASADAGESKEEKAEPAETPTREEKDEGKEEDKLSGGASKGESSDSGKQVSATSVARKIAEENKIDLSSVRGTGPAGRITREDVERVVASLEEGGEGPRGAQFTSVDNIQRLPAPPPASFSPGDASAEAAKPSAQQETPKVKAEPASPPPSPAASSSPAAGEDQTREKMSMLRRRIAQRLVEAQHNAAMLTTFNDVDMSAVMELRKQFKEPFKEKHGVGLGFMSFFVKASIEALKAFPRVNAFIDGNEIVKNHRHHVGVAVSTPKGLVVPVVRNAGDLTFAQIESAIMDVALRARDGDLDIDEMQGGTFTITNGGVFGSMLSTPILNPPQSAILGMHRIEDRPVARDGQVVIRPMMYLALSYDHRIVDGREAVGFLVRIKECIENPSRLLLEV